MLGWPSPGGASSGPVSCRLFEKASSKTAQMTSFLSALKIFDRCQGGFAHTLVDYQATFSPC
ncbi:hypothetical protein FHS21_003157 [Phyllobacterium trifolii]|uniref:Uncharacterized protein n=1 Tax=Phyllobacterium trifolii TaxID=300193 RepID=A0A839UDI6_9HYPH|nr:hypothetical protein [Phyllobacterium trifolii]